MQTNHASKFKATYRPSKREGQDEIAVNAIRIR